MTASSVLFSVIIPTCNRPDRLKECLEALQCALQALPAGSHETIVTDDGIAPSAEPMLRIHFPWVRWTAGARRGPAANRNHGARQARGEWLIFTDDDCLPDAGWLDAYARAIERDPARQVWEGRTYVDRPQTHFLEVAPVNDHGGNLWSCNFAIRRALFADMHGFDERFLYAAMEDMELNARLRSRGVASEFLREAAIMHPWRKVHNWPAHCRRSLKSRLLMEELHPGGGFPWPWWHVLLRAGKSHSLHTLPHLRRHGLAYARHLPVSLRYLLLEVYLTWRRPPAKSFDVGRSS